ncbi:splicing factor 3B subunit 2 [Vairimorpha necatrix]|uniref:Splicing factor 3B subunit 2 n=1 Tax=Vairimorpha necatrix TaxID=6039 RepID=A0AAX4J8J5_9MICR
MNVSKDYAFIHKKTKKKLNKKDKKLLYRTTLFNSLKLSVPYPDLLEIEDIKSPDLIFYNKLKNLHNSVPVIKRWKYKHLFPLNYKKKDYTIPLSIINTGLELLRLNILEVKRNQSDKQKFMNKLFPKLGKASINPRRLYEAFGNFKPFVFPYGEPFDFTWEKEKKRFSPGMLTDELRLLLGMNEFSPPPWIFKMQKVGPPPSYPDLKIPGVNTNIPPGCQYGYEPNRWGKPQFIPEEKEEYIYNLETQYTSLCKKQEPKDELKGGAEQKLDELKGEDKQAEKEQIKNEEGKNEEEKQIKKEDEQIKNEIKKEEEKQIKRKDKKKNQKSKLRSKI